MIGVFDSGVGGLTVVRHLMRELPYQSLVYFGDTARLPYGDKSGEVIQKYARDNAEFLLTQKIQLLVIACNSASAHAYELLKRELPIPVIDVITPGVEWALEAGQRIAVLGTHATISSAVYERELKKRRHGLEVTSITCPLLAPLIEECGLSHPALDLFVKEYLKPLQGKKIDTVILGCTHYPFLQEKIQKELSSDVRIIDSGLACAKAVGDFVGISEEKEAVYRFFVSDNPTKFQTLATQLVGNLPGRVEKAPCQLREEKAYA